MRLASRLVARRAELFTPRPEQIAPSSGLFSRGAEFTCSACRPFSRLSELFSPRSGQITRRPELFSRHAEFIFSACRPFFSGHRALFSIVRENYSAARAFFSAVPTFCSTLRAVRDCPGTGRDLVFPPIDRSTGWPCRTNCYSGDSRSAQRWRLCPRLAGQPR